VILGQKQKMTGRQSNPTAQRLRRFLSRHLSLLSFLAASLALRIFIFLHITPRIHTDSVTYLILSDLKTVRTPGYPFFIEFVQFFNDLFSLTPRSIWLIVFFQLFLLGPINCYLIYRLSRSVTRSRGFAWAMGVLYHLNFFVIGFEFIILTETLTFTLLGLTILFFIRIFQGSRSAAVPAGIFSVWLVLTRPTFLAFFLVLFGLGSIVYFRAVFKAGRIRGPLNSLFVFILINLAGIGAWSWRNEVRYDYFGISSLLPFQLSYYTREFCDQYQMGSDPRLDRFAAILIQEKGQPFNFAERLEALGVPPAEVSRILLQINLRLIKENFGDYLRLVPGAAADYFACSWAWTEGRAEGLFMASPALAHVWTLFLKGSGEIFGRPLGWLIVVLIIPAALIVLRRKTKDVLLLLCLLEGAVIYNTLISILLTNADVNNMRFRLPVEPFIWLLAGAAVFAAAKSLVVRLRGVRRRFSMRPRTR
jgi:hypothetical protein